MCFRTIWDVTKYTCATISIWCLGAAIYVIAPAQASLVILASLLAIIVAGMYFGLMRLVRLIYYLLFYDFSLMLLEGPIGAGKTVFFEHLKRSVGSRSLWTLWRPRFYEEKIVNTELTQFYTDQKSTAMTFDQRMQQRRENDWMTMQRSWTQSSCDRQLPSTIVFARVNYVLGNLAWNEYESLLKLPDLFDRIRTFQSKDFMRRPVTMVYMSADYRTCADRAAQRPGVPPIALRYHQMVCCVYALFMLELHRANLDQSILRFVVMDTPFDATPARGRFYQGEWHISDLFVAPFPTYNVKTKLQQLAADNCAMKLSRAEFQRLTHCCGRSPGLIAQQSEVDNQETVTITYNPSLERD